MSDSVAAPDRLRSIRPEHAAEERRQRGLLAAIESSLQSDFGATGHGPAGTGAQASAPPDAVPADGAAPTVRGEGATAWAGERGRRLAEGLAAYSGNASSTAARALELAYPTLCKLIGIKEFGHVARGLWLASPPACGDLGAWGAELPDWIDADPALRPWPYLSDCARLDRAVHRCERAADARLNAGSLRLLDTADPARLGFSLAPGTAVLDSPWPIATLHAAHRGDEPRLEPARAALATGRGECVLVVRAGWRADVRAVERPTLAWTEALLQGRDVAAALELAGPSFDLADWLATALRCGWLQAVVCRGA